MNFGADLYTWFLSNAQSLVLAAIGVIGISLGFKRVYLKLMGLDEERAKKNKQQTKQKKNRLCSPVKYRVLLLKEYGGMTV